MIEYSAQDRKWFDSQVPGTQQMRDKARIATRLDEAIAHRGEISISPLQLILLSAEGERRAYVAKKRAEREHFLRAGRVLLVWLTTFSLFVAFVVWMIQR